MGGGEVKDSADVTGFFFPAVTEWIVVGITKCRHLAFMSHQSMCFLSFIFIYLFCSFYLGPTHPFTPNVRFFLIFVVVHKGN